MSRYSFKVIRFVPAGWYIPEYAAVACPVCGKGHETRFDTELSARENLISGMCQACHVRMRLQIWVEVKKNEQLFQCESCSRVLYYEPPPPTVVAEP